jgi:hypothetical protein
MRIYVPRTGTTLRLLAERRTVSPAPVFGCAVTPELRDYFPGADDDELDAEALRTAAAESLRMLAADDGEDRRRAVLAVEAADAVVTADPGAGRTAVLVSVEVPITDVVAIYVDGDDAHAAVAAATSALDAADRGDHDAARTVRLLDDHELLWYGTQELRDLVAG